MTFEWIEPAPGALAGFEWESGALGAGPGETRDYFVDVPEIDIGGVFSIGGQQNVRFGLPMQALVGDAVAYAAPYIPYAVDNAIARARQHLPYLGPEVANAVWPTLQRQIEAELPRLIAQVQPEVKKIEKRFEWALGLTVVGVAAVAGVFWWKMRGSR